MLLASGKTTANETKVLVPPKKTERSSIQNTVQVELPAKREKSSNEDQQAQRPITKKGRTLALNKCDAPVSSALPKSQ